MGRGKSPKVFTKEHTELQKARQEIKVLRRQVSRFKKLLKKIDYERFENLSEVMEAQAKEEKGLEKKIKEIDVAERWKCFDCEGDYLRIIVINRPDGPFYFRRCPSCGRKTKSKPLKNDTEGIEEHGIDNNREKELERQILEEKAGK